MFNTKTLLFTIVAIILFTSCEPKVIQNDSAKLFSLCCGSPLCVSNSLYNSVISRTSNSGFFEDSLPIKLDDNDISDLQVLLDEDYYEEAGGYELYCLINEGVILDSAPNAYNIVYKVFHGNFEYKKKEFCEQVEVYDYRKNDNRSSRKVTVYDVVYKLPCCICQLENGKHVMQKERYALCSVYDLGNGKVQFDYSHSNEEYSGLGL